MPVKSKPFSQVTLFSRRMWVSDLHTHICNRQKGDLLFKPSKSLKSERVNMDSEKNIAHDDLFHSLPCYFKFWEFHAEIICVSL